MKICKHLFIIFILSKLVLAESVSVHFEIISRNMAKDSTLYICGNQELLGNWNPAGLALQKINDTLWTTTLSLPKNAPVEYKFTQGSWTTEPLDERGNPFSNFQLIAHSDTTIIHRFTHWKKLQSTETGTIVHHRNLRSEGLLPRDIHVWLPPDYNIHINRRYPVLYMQDGQNIFDSKTASFGTEWQADETADSLIRAGLIEPLIIVAIDNTAQRTPEYSYTETGQCYREFIINRVKPFVDKNYRTIPDRNHTAVGGSSLGALVAFIFLWEHNQVFSKAICMSPAFKIEDFDAVTPVRTYTGRKKDITLYIDNGGIDLERELQHGVDEMLKALREKEYIDGKDYFWVWDKNAAHNEAAWRKRLPSALIFLFGN